MAESHEQKGSSQQNFGSTTHSGGGSRPGATSVAPQSGNIASAVTDKVKDAASTVGDYAKDAKDKVSDVAGQATHKAQEWAGQASDKAQEWAHSATNRIGDAKDAVRDWSHEAYEHPTETMKSATDQMSSIIRTYPIPALLVGFGLGYFLAHLTTSDRR